MTCPADHHFHGKCEDCLEGICTMNCSSATPCDPALKAAMVEVTEIDKECLRQVAASLACGAQGLAAHQIARHRLAAIQSAPPPVAGGEGGLNVPDGWQLVPINLPDDMAKAGARGRQNSAISSFRDGWKFALAAAPTPPLATPATGGTFADGVANQRRLALEDADALDRIAEEADDNGWQDWGAIMRQAAQRFRAAIRALQPGAGREDGETWASIAA